jgi:molybdate/tungstate transport system ATP-binding protein
MTALALAGVSVTLGTFALGEISFELPAPEILVVLGPNGAGKSVLLETIAGFHRPSRGHVVIRDRDVTMLPPEQRGVGFLVQNFGLFPHLTVVQNVALAARLRRGPDAPADVRQLLARFGIAQLADASPLVLSPGEKQRVALARAQASRPDIFLLDEPFAALDAAARDELRLELVRFLHEAQVPALFVTHDYTDVAALGDRVAIMRNGRILQLDRAAEVFRRPASREVAEILGTENLLSGWIDGRDGDRLRAVVAGHTLVAMAREGGPVNGGVQIVIRADAVRVIKPDRASEMAENCIVGTVTALQNLGVLTKLTIESGMHLVACLMTRDVTELGLTLGATVAAHIPIADVHLLAA